jgi:HD-GYP domain-containing protein (c-di-GMP phosphodiesterase class II)
MSMANKPGKIAVVVGEPLPENIKSADGSVVLVTKGTIVTRLMVNRLSNWIFEDEPRLPVEKTPRAPVKKSAREAILKRLEFQEIVSKKTRKEIEKNAAPIFERGGKPGDKLDISAIGDSIAGLIEETPDDPDVPLKLFDLKHHASYIFQHSVECAVLSSFIATALNYTQHEISEFVLAMMLHDIGVLSIQGDILDKSGPLTPAEWEQVHLHPKLGWDILKSVPGIESLALLIAIGHHTRADGTGYPADVDFNSLPPQVHLSSIINHFEALTSARPFRPAYSLHAAIKIILNQRDNYNPAVLDNFISVVGIYPISTFVQLNTSEIGVVVRNNPENMFLPEIKLVLDPAGKTYSKEIIVNLLTEPSRQITRVVDKL